MSAWLQTKSWEEAKEAIVKSKGVAIVPIGSVEQHSYHLPLGTDTYVAMTIAEEAAEKTGAVLTPPFGSAGARITWYYRGPSQSDLSTV